MRWEYGAHVESLDSTCIPHASNNVKTGVSPQLKEGTVGGTSSVLSRKMDNLASCDA